MPCLNHPGVAERLVRCTRCGRSFCRDCVVSLAGSQHCGACKLEFVRDLRSGAMRGALEIASVGRRWLGVIVDQFLIGMLAFLVMMGAAFLAAAATQLGGSNAQGVAGVLFMVCYLATVFGVPIAYDAFMIQTRGQTLGKMAVGVKVVRVDGTDVSAGQAWGRAAAKVLLGSCMGLGYLPALFTREKTAAHDMVARTRVVRMYR